MIEGAEGVISLWNGFVDFTFEYKGLLFFFLALFVGLLVCLGFASKILSVSLTFIQMKGGLF